MRGFGYLLAGILFLVALGVVGNLFSFWEFSNHNVAQVLSVFVINPEVPANQPTLTVHVVVSGGSASPSNFTLLLDGLGIPSDVATTTSEGTHAVSEVANSNYSSSFGGDCDSVGHVTLALNDTKTCILTNTFISPGGNNGGGSGGSSGGGSGGSFAYTTPPPVVVKGALCTKKGDLNGDGKVNIIDFSILAYWYKRPLTPTAIVQCVDLNSDGKVTLADFSILAYYWNR